MNQRDGLLDPHLRYPLLWRSHLSRTRSNGDSTLDIMHDTINKKKRKEMGAAESSDVREQEIPPTRKNFTELNGGKIAGEAVVSSSSGQVVEGQVTVTKSLIGPRETAQRVRTRPISFHPSPTRPFPFRRP